MYALINHINNGNLDEIKRMLENSNIDIHENNEYIFRLACFNGKVEVIKYLLTTSLISKQMINIHALNEWAFHIVCAKGEVEVVKYLCDICDEYSYDMDENKIIPIITFYSLDKMQKLMLKQEEVECLICKASLSMTTLGKASLSMTTLGKASLSMTTLGKASAMTTLGKYDESDLINLNCSNKYKHIYCKTCLDEIYKTGRRCVYCMEMIDKSKMQQIVFDKGILIDDDLR